MDEFKFLHTADIHIDYPFNINASKPEMADERKNDIIKTFDNIINIAKEKKVHAVFICGDLFEHNYTSRKSAEHVLNAFKETGIDIVIVPGNHDPFMDGSWYKRLNWPENVIVLTAQNPSCTLQGGEIKIWGLGFTKFFQNVSLLDERTIDEIKDWTYDSTFNILLCHGSIDSYMTAAEGIKGANNPVKSTDIAELGVDYAGIGHFHQPVENIGGYKIIYNSGSPEPLSFDETREHGIISGRLFYTNEGKELETEFIEISQKKYININIDAVGFKSYKEVVAKALKSLPQGTNTDRYICRAKVLHNTMSSIDCNNIGFELSSYFYFCQTEFIKVKDYLISETLKEKGIKGVFAQKIKDKFDKAATERERIIIKRAFEIGIDELEKIEKVSEE